MCASASGSVRGWRRLFFVLEAIAIFGCLYGMVMDVSYRYYSRHGVNWNGPFVAYSIFSFLEQRVIVAACSFFAAALLLTVASPFCMLSKPLRLSAVIGWFQLTMRLWRALRASGCARVVSLSSLGHRFSSVALDDPNFLHRAYDPWKAYG
jgi:hypothetical protein